MTLLERTYAALECAGLDVRLATRHDGKCAAPYCVAYDGKTVPLGKTLCRRHILIDALAPAGTPEALPGFTAEIRAAARLGAGLDFEGAGDTVALEDYRAVAQTLDFSALCGTNDGA